MDLLNLIPDLTEIIRKSSQSAILLFLYAVGFLARRIKVIENRHIPSLILIASILISPFLIQPYRDAFIMAFIYAGISLLSYEAVIRRVEAWIAEKLGKNDSVPKVQERPFKE